MVRESTRDLSNELRLVHDVLKKLSDKKGYSHDEIAELFNVNVDTVTLCDVVTDSIFRVVGFNDTGRAVLKRVYINKLLRIDGDVYITVDADEGDMEIIGEDDVLVQVDHEGLVPKYEPLGWEIV